MKDRLSHSHYLIEQLSLKGSNPYPISRPKSMEDDMVSDSYVYLPVNDTGFALPKDLQ